MATHAFIVVSFLILPGLSESLNTVNAKETPLYRFMSLLLSQRKVLFHLLHEIQSHKMMAYIKDFNVKCT